MIVTETNIHNAAILIVYDQEANIRLLEQLLGETGYSSVTSTMNPEEVSKLYRENGYDLILLDLVMPSMDGFQVMEELKVVETDSYVPVILLSG